MTQIAPTPTTATRQSKARAATGAAIPARAPPSGKPDCLMDKTRARDRGWRAACEDMGGRRREQAIGQSEAEAGHGEGGNGCHRRQTQGRGNAGKTELIGPDRAQAGHQIAAQGRRDHGPKEQQRCVAPNQIGVDAQVLRRFGGQHRYGEDPNCADGLGKSEQCQRNQKDVHRVPHRDPASPTPTLTCILPRESVRAPQFRPPCPPDATSVAERPAMI